MSTWKYAKLTISLVGIHESRQRNRYVSTYKRERVPAARCRLTGICKIQKCGQIAHVYPFVQWINRSTSTRPCVNGNSQKYQTGTTEWLTEKEASFLRKRVRKNFRELRHRPRFFYAILIKSEIKIVIIKFALGFVRKFGRRCTGLQVFRYSCVSYSGGPPKPDTRS